MKTVNKLLYWTAEEKIKGDPTSFPGSSPSRHPGNEVDHDLESRSYSDVSRYVTYCY